MCQGPSIEIKQDRSYIEEYRSIYHPIEIRYVNGEDITDNELWLMSFLSSEMEMWAIMNKHIDFLNELIDSPYRRPFLKKLFNDPNTIAHTKVPKYVATLCVSRHYTTEEKLDILRKIYHHYYNITFNDEKSLAGYANYEFNPEQFIWCTALCYCRNFTYTTQDRYKDMISRIIRGLCRGDEELKKSSFDILEQM